RPGLVYGGNPGSVYKTLILLTKSSIMLPSFFPTVYVQPISVEDICKALLRLAVKPDLVQKEFNIAAHKPISFSKFLKELAWRRLHRLRFFIPFPAFILQILLGAGSLFSANVMNLSVRFRSLLQTPYIATETSLDILDMELSDLPEGFWLNRTAGRRQLLEEGRAILRYVSGRAPSPSMISRYVKAIELSKDSKALGLQNIVLTFPKLLYLLEGRGIIKRPTVFKELERRLDFALVLAEASVDNIDDFILHKSVSKIKVILLIFWVLSKEILMQMIRPLISLVLRWFIK
ncbi:uncharacterized protein METZ01_LOCUS285512, partial [marine metagenome]